MTPAKPSVTGGTEAQRQRRIGPTLAAFVLGLPLAGAILAAVQYGPLHGTEVARYLSHPVERVEVILFSCAMGAFVAKLIGLLIERAAAGRQPLPLWDGKAVPVSEASRLLAEVDRQPRWFAGTWLGRRITAVLEFLVKRRSAG